MPAPRARAATLTGTFLSPGVSANRRLYSREAIASAVEGMKAALTSNGLPLTMQTGHPEQEAENVLRTVGRIVEVWQDAETGKGKFRADVPDTTAGRDLVALVAPGGKGENVEPYVGSVSIRGAWASTPRVEKFEGQEVETADKLRVGHVDWTTTPGVNDARIENVELFEKAAAAFPICESVAEDGPLSETVSDALVVEVAAPAEIVETATQSAPTPAVAPSGASVTPIIPAPVESVTTSVHNCPSCGQSIATGETSMSDPKVAAESAPAPATDSQKAIKEAVAKAVKKALKEARKAAKAPVTEQTTPAPVAETQKAPDVQALVEAAVAKERSSILEELRTGGVVIPRAGRKVLPIAESMVENLATMSDDSPEFKAYERAVADQILDETGQRGHVLYGGVGSQG